MTSRATVGTGTLLALVLALLAGCGVSTNPPARRAVVPLPPLASRVSLDISALPAGRESMYDLVNAGTLPVADDLVNNIWDIPRSAPVTLPANLTWTEDPYHDPYWRFEFYSLRVTSNLLWAYTTTHQPKYLDKLLTILQSFTTYDATNPAADRERLDYAYGAAFRAMILVNNYGKLQRGGVLAAPLATALRGSIAKLATFLARPKNYRGTHNHGLTEAAALLLLAVNFPDLPSAAQEKQLALDRLGTLMQTIVGDDGVEIERSPLYHFYVFNFALQLEDWAARNGVSLPAAFSTRVASMVRYSTDIIWPNGLTPLIGSSMRLRPAGYAALYGTLEKTDPQFAYAVTSGSRGSPPAERAALFPTSGQVVLRAALTPGTPYVDNTQLVLNDGDASTAHSRLDALAIDFYSGGRVLLPDSGLGTYNPGTAFAFFHGTSAQNTVVVDGKDQGPGKVTTGLVRAGPGWEYASGVELLNAGVTARRSVLMIGHNLVLVADSLTSSATHDYEQLWHLFPGAHLTMNAGAAEVSSGQDQRVLQIVQNQLAPAPTVQTYYGDMAPMQGWYSEVYGQLQKNHVVGYTERGTRASFLTLLTVGPDAGQPARIAGSSTASGATISAHLCAADLSADVIINQQASVGEAVTVTSGRGGCPHGG